MTELGRKVCVKCGAEKSAKSFSTDRRRKDGLFPYCAACKAHSVRKVQRSDGELNGHTCPLCLTPIRGHVNRRYCSTYCKNRTKALKEKFNLTPVDYRDLLDDAAGRCPICNCKVTKPTIDHDHKSLAVTGIVCVRCNVGLLAYSNHDVAIARRLVEFLENPPVERVLGKTILARPDQTSPGLHSVWKRGKEAA